MSFHESAASYELEDGHILKAVLVDADGNEQTSKLDLNTVLRNDNGRRSPQNPPISVGRLFYNANICVSIGTFVWKDDKFSDSAQDVELSTEGDDSVPVLRAKLGNLDGEEIDADINLAERITNDNGILGFN